MCSGSIQTVPTVYSFSLGWYGRPLLFGGALWNYEPFAECMISMVRR